MWTREKRYVWAWGSTGEEKWNPDMEIRVDWKSLVRTALLPLTTDFFPDKRSIDADYVTKVIYLLGSFCYFWYNPINFRNCSLWHSCRLCFRVGIISRYTERNLL